MGCDAEKHAGPYFPHTGSLWNTVLFTDIKMKGTQPGSTWGPVGRWGGWCKLSLGPAPVGPRHLAQAPLTRPLTRYSQTLILCRTPYVVLSLTTHQGPSLLGWLSRLRHAPLAHISISSPSAPFKLSHYFWKRHCELPPRPLCLGQHLSPAPAFLLFSVYSLSLQPPVLISALASSRDLCPPPTCSITGASPPNSCNTHLLIT